MATEEEQRRARAFAEECGQALGTFQAVRSLPEHPGWLVMMQSLHDMAKLERETLQGHLDSILIDDKQDARHEYHQSKIRLLALEQCIQIYSVLHERAVNAKNYLDSLPPGV